MATLARRVRKSRGIEKVQPNTNPVYCIGKRVFDVVFSLAALFLLSPLFFLTAVAIKLEDPKGRVFYAQARAGKHGTPFQCYKFRSMYARAEEYQEEYRKKNEMDGPVFKMRTDPRVTRVGYLIRKASIDELPQLYNVLRGEMSIVGPRPLAVAEALQCNATQRQREQVTPGLTCYWQVSGRNTLSFARWMELDVRYVAEQSFGLDMLLILRTIPAVLSAKGAY